MTDYDEMKKIGKQLPKGVNVPYWVKVQKRYCHHCGKRIPKGVKGSFCQLKCEIYHKRLYKTNKPELEALHS